MFRLLIAPQVRQPGGHGGAGDGLPAGVDRVLEVRDDRVGAPAADPGQPIGPVAGAVQVASRQPAARGHTAADRHGQILPCASSRAMSQTSRRRYSVWNSISWNGTLGKKGLAE